MSNLQIFIGNMNDIEFLKLRELIHDKFHCWFSYRRKLKCLYSDWNPSDIELNLLLKFVEPYGLSVLFVLPCSVVIYGKK